MGNGIPRTPCIGSSSNLSVSTPPETQFTDLPLELQGYIVHLAGNSIRNTCLVNRHFRDRVASETLMQRLIGLCENEDAVDSLRRFNLTPSLRCPKDTFLEKIKSLVTKVLPSSICRLETPRENERITCYQSLRKKVDFLMQRILKPDCEIAPQRAYKGLYENIAILKTSLEADLGYVFPYTVTEMLSDPTKLANSFDDIYLTGIKNFLLHILNPDIVFPITVPTETLKRLIEDMQSKIQQAERSHGRAAAIRIAFQLAQENGVKVANELNGTWCRVWIRGIRAWCVDSYFFPTKFVELIDSPSCKQKMRGEFIHQDSCYCKFVPNSCYRRRAIGWGNAPE